MKQVVLKIPDSKYLAFINFVKSKFSDIQIKEKDDNEYIVKEESNDETLFLSEKTLSEDWLSGEDSRWDKVL